MFQRHGRRRHVMVLGRASSQFQPVVLREKRVASSIDIFTVANSFQSVRLPRVGESIYVAEGPENPPRRLWVGLSARWGLPDRPFIAQATQAAPWKVFARFIRSS